MYTSNITLSVSKADIYNGHQFVGQFMPMPDQSKNYLTYLKVLSNQGSVSD